jgi:hypothetical protein
MIICTTPIQRILSQLQSVGLSIIKYKVANNGNGMTNTAIPSSGTTTRAQRLDVSVLKSNFATLFFVIHFVNSSSQPFLEQPNISGSIERQPVRLCSLWTWTR